MAQNNLAEQWEEDTIPDTQDKDKGGKVIEAADRFGKGKTGLDNKGLTPNELKRSERGDLSINQIKVERNNLAIAANAELKAMLTTTSDNRSLISPKEHKDFQKEIDETFSAEKMKAILDRIKEIPRKRQEESKRKEEESKLLDPNHPELIKLQNKFNQICDDNRHLIGEGQIQGFKAWFEKQRKEHPQVGHLKELIERLDGKINDRNGLAPRREEYQKLTDLFKKSKLNSPQESKFIKREGLSERKAFRKNAEEMQDHLRQMKDTGFYSDEMIQETMKTMLLAESLNDQRNTILKAKNLAKIEAMTFTYLDAKMTIQGVTIRRMSKKEKAKLLQHYKTFTTDDQKRKNLLMWPGFIDAEAHLAEELEEIYKNDPENLKLALVSFGELDFDQKKEALEEHKRLVEQTKSKEELKEKLLIKAAHAKIDEAARKKILSSSTQVKYKKFFEDKENFKNQLTKKPGDLKELENAYKTLINPSPNDKYKNLASYEERRKEFKEGLKLLSEINQNLSKEELKERQEKYDREGWTKRGRIFEDLISEIGKEKQEKAKERELKKKVGMEGKESKKDKKEGKENAPKLAETIRAVAELLANKQGGEAMKMLLKYNEANPDDKDNKDVLVWTETVGRHIKEFGFGERADNLDKEINKELKDMSSSNEVIKEELEEQRIIETNLEGTELSEERHEKKRSAQDRAKDESMERTKGDEIKTEITEAFYDQTDKDHILNTEKETGEEIEEIKFDDIKMVDEERQSMKEETVNKTNRLFDKKGFTDVTLKDKDGKEISTQEAKTRHQGKNQKLANKMAKEAENRIKRKTGETKGAKLFDLSARIANQRQARELVEKEIKDKEKLRNAA